MYRPDHGHNNWWIKAYIITMMNNADSVVSTRKLLHSIKTSGAMIQPFIMPATIPETMEDDLDRAFDRSYSDILTTKDNKIRYTWPIHTSQDGLDLATGLYKRAYAAKDWRKVLSCSISHMRLWQHCIDINEPIVILEHDAYFTSEIQFSYKSIALAGHVTAKVKSGEAALNENSMQWTGGICGLNDPAGATRKARVFDSKVKEYLKNEPGLAPVPYLDDPSDYPLPCGLAGNSAYIIKPWAAKKLLDKTAEIGIWPNDALMCRQFFPWLQVSYPYFTTIQNTKSTTTT